MSDRVEIDGKPYPALQVDGYPRAGWRAVLPLETGLVACVHAPTEEYLYSRDGVVVIDDEWYVHLSEPFDLFTVDLLADPYCESDGLTASDVVLTIAEWSYWSREAAQAWKIVAPWMCGSDG